MRTLLGLAALSAASGASPKYDADVVVVGCGPVGMFATLALEQHGVKVICLEREEELYHAPRAVVWDPETLRLRRHLSTNMSDWMLEHVLTMKPFAERDGIGVRNGPPPSFLTWYLIHEGEHEQKAAVRNSMAGYNLHNAFHQPSFELRMREEHSDVRKGCKVTAVKVVGAGSEQEHAEVTHVVHRAGRQTETVTLRSRFVFGADGASSTVRKQIGATYGGDTFGEQPWIVIDTEIHDEEYLRSSWVSRHGDMFVTDPRRPFVFVRTPSFHTRWTESGEDLQAEVRRHVEGGSMPKGTSFRFEFLLNADEDKDESRKEANVRKLLAEVGIDFDRVEVVRSIVYTFHARRASAWARGPVFLLGDAAHCMPPFQGQGLNSGIRDAGNLAWKIAAVVRGEAPRQLLDSYEVERRSNFEQTITNTVFFGNMIMVRDTLRAFVRDVFLTISARLMHLFGYGINTPPRFARAISRPVPFIRNPGAFIDFSAGTVAGTLVPNPVLTTKGGDERLLDLSFSPNGWTIVCTAQAPGECDGPATQVLTVVVAAAGSGLTASDAGVNLQDVDGHWTEWVQTAPAKVALVRPDKYIYGVYPSVLAAADAKAHAIQAGVGVADGTCSSR